MDPLGRPVPIPSSIKLLMVDPHNTAALDTSSLLRRALSSGKAAAFVSQLPSGPRHGLSLRCSHRGRSSTAISRAAAAI